MMVDSRERLDEAGLFESYLRLEFKVLEFFGAGQLKLGINDIQGATLGATA